jgi:SAM-dependent methyltransferase
MTADASAVRESYNSMAAVYDRFTAHHDYAAWTATLEGLATRHGLVGRRLLDAGCGTGKSFLPLLRRGYDVTAFDLSPAMARLAAAKAPDAAVHVHDIRTVPVLGEFDLVCCLDDCLNHLLDPEQLANAFRALARNLAPAGVLMFDVNTLATYRGFFAELTVSPAPDEVLIWSGEADGTHAESEEARATLSAFRRQANGRWEQFSLQHRQRHHGRARICAALEDARLEPVAVYGQGLDGVPEPELDELVHTKAVYLARHARSNQEGR